VRASGGPGGSGARHLARPVLLDTWLPEYDVSKRHSIEIAAPRERVYEELLRYDLGRSLVTGILMTLRGYGALRDRAREGGEPSSLVERLERFAFTLLEERPGEELVFGLVGRFWRRDGGLLRLTRDEFGSFRDPGFAKAAWNLKVDEGLLSTETRVQCLGEEARRKFLPYWRLIEPFSGAIRRSLLRGIRRAATSSALT
jgi:hypothetical protein